MSARKAGEERRRPMRHARHAAPLLAVLMGLPACSGGDPGSGGAAGTAGAPAAGGNPLGTLSRGASDSAPLTGRVEERLAAGSYTYLALRGDDGAFTWVVALGSGERPGTRVKVRSMGRRTNFRSNRLGRTFPALVFGIVSRLD